MRWDFSSLLVICGIVLTSAFSGRDLTDILLKDDLDQRGDDVQHTAVFLSLPSVLGHADDFTGPHGTRLGSPEDANEAEATQEERARAEQVAEQDPALSVADYDEDATKQIARSQVTSIGKQYNGSYSTIEANGKVQDMVNEYKEAAKNLAIQKDINRIKGNNATAQFADVNNAALKAREEKQHTTQTNFTVSTINSTKEKYIADSANEKLMHATECQRMMQNNPYPPGSMQYKAVAIACRDEDSRNLDPHKVVPKGSHDEIYGAYEDSIQPQDPADITALSLDASDIAS